MRIRRKVFGRWTFYGSAVLDPESWIVGLEPSVELNVCGCGDHQFGLSLYPLPMVQIHLSLYRAGDGPKDVAA